MNSTGTCDTPNESFSLQQNTCITEGGVSMSKIIRFRFFVFVLTSQVAKCVAGSYTYTECTGNTCSSGTSCNTLTGTAGQCKIAGSAGYLVICKTVALQFVLTRAKALRHHAACTRQFAASVAIASSKDSFVDLVLNFVCVKMEAMLRERQKLPIFQGVLVSVVM